MDEADFVSAILRASDEATVRGILAEVCRIGGMGFAALACIAGPKWITCQVRDRIDFGLNPGDELELQTTVCNDLLTFGRPVVVDDIDTDPHWRTHPVPLMYGFKSCATFPVELDDGHLFGTLCTIDMERRRLNTPETIERLRALADRAGHILSRRLPDAPRERLQLAPANDDHRESRNAPSDRSPQLCGSNRATPAP